MHGEEQVARTQKEGYDSEGTQSQSLGTFSLQQAQEASSPAGF